jgi:3-methyladenine DNA glycosylase/8-oxoguanine DNA glycosylase
MKLKKVKSFELIPTAPFNFDATFYKPAHFHSRDNFWKPGTRWQTWFWDGKKLGIKFESDGTVYKPKIVVTVYYHSDLNSGFFKSLEKEIIYRYNLNLDLREFYKKFMSDKILGPIIKRWNGLRPGHQSSLYEYLIIGIVLQNATVKRSINMLQALYENYGKLLEYDGKKLWCFWKPGGLSKVSEEELRTLKIGYRAKFIKKIDGQFAKKEIDEMELRKEDFETQKQELLKLYGVGPATVWYLLFDVFHHYDFFEHISPWEQKIYSKLFFNRDPKKPVSVDKLIKYFERFGKYRQLAVHYVWDDVWWRHKNNKIPWLENLIRN